MKAELNLWKAVGSTVEARRHIADSPLAKMDSSAARGERGEVVDFDGDDWLLVDFGKGAIICDPRELKFIYAR